MQEKIRVEEIEFSKRINEISETKDTFIRRALLNLASRQNDLIFSLHQKQSRGEKN